LIRFFNSAERNLPMLKLRIESWKLLEPDKCVIVTEGVEDLWPLIILSNTHSGCRLTILNVLLTTKIRLDKHTWKLGNSNPLNGIKERLINDITRIWTTKYHLLCF